MVVVGKAPIPLAVAVVETEISPLFTIALPVSLTPEIFPDPLRTEIVPALKTFCIPKKPAASAVSVSTEIVPVAVFTAP